NAIVTSTAIVFVPICSCCANNQNDFKGDRRCSVWLDEFVSSCDFVYANLYLPIGQKLADNPVSVVRSECPLESFKSVVRVSTRVFDKQKENLSARWNRDALLWRLERVTVHSRNGNVFLDSDASCRNGGRRDRSKRSDDCGSLKKRHSSNEN